MFVNCFCFIKLSKEVFPELVKQKLILNIKGECVIFMFYDKEQLKRGN